MEQKAKRVTFLGRVQGVGFRYTTDGIAKQYNVTGFVRNLSDGTVEMLVQGPAQEIDNCIDDVRSEFAGYIRETRIEEAPFNPRYKDFRITF
jgi:acylphosphatase